MGVRGQQAGRGLDELMSRLVAYWALKRDARDGVPILRRLQSGHVTQIRQRVRGQREQKARARIILNYLRMKLLKKIQSCVDFGS